MVIRDVAIGGGLTVYGLGLGFLLNRYRTRPETRLRVAKARWPVDRRTAGRRGLSQEQWFATYAESQRRLVTWFMLPFAGVFVALALAQLIYGLSH